MNTFKSTSKHNNNLTNALTKGLLVWGPLYSTSASGAAYLLMPLLTERTATYAEIFLQALLIFPACTLVGSLAHWRLSSKYAATAKTKRTRSSSIHRFTSRSRSVGMRHKHA